MKHSYKGTFEGMTLLPLTEITSEKYRVLRNNPEIRRWFTFNNEISKTQQKEWFNNYMKDPNDVMFAIFNGSGNFVGANSLYDIDEHSAEYGRIVIDSKYSGNGYGYKATIAAMLIARNQMDLKSIRLEVYSKNIPALNIYRKVGFEEIGEIKDSSGNSMRTMKIDLNTLDIGGQ